MSLDWRGRQVKGTLPALSPVRLSVAQFWRLPISDSPLCFSMRDLEWGISKDYREKVRRSFLWISYNLLFWFSYWETSSRISRINRKKGVRKTKTSPIPSLLFWFSLDFGFLGSLERTSFFYWETSSWRISRDYWFSLLRGSVVLKAQEMTEKGLKEKRRLFKILKFWRFQISESLHFWFSLLRDFCLPKISR